MTEIKDIVKKYKDKIYMTDEHGDQCYNLRTVRSIVSAAGLKGAQIISHSDRRDCEISINFSHYPHYGVATKEVEALYNFAKNLSA